MVSVVQPIRLPLQPLALELLNGTTQRVPLYTRETPSKQLLLPQALPTLCVMLLSTLLTLPDP